MNDYKELFEAGNKAQLEQMERFEDDKDGWENIDLCYGVNKLKQKAIETKEHLERLSQRIFEGDKYKRIEKKETLQRIEDIRKKAAHSANFAHMIIMACDKELSTCGQVVDNA